MCAIAGLIDLQLPEGASGKILDTMIRRGPDDTGIYKEGNCTLFHARLAVIDPAGGSQPMLLSQKGEEYKIVYNGELYNTEEIKNELLKLGHRFSGHSDTEVVLHSYAQWGAE